MQQRDKSLLIPILSKENDLLHDIWCFEVIYNGLLWKGIKYCLQKRKNKNNVCLGIQRHLFCN